MQENKQDAPEQNPAPFKRSEAEAALEVNDKVWFVGEKQPMFLKTQSERYAIFTKPFYPQKTVIYCIADFKDQKKAPNNLVFKSYDYQDQASIEECLVDLEAGKIELSRRNGVDLHVDFDRTAAYKQKISK